MAEEPESGRHLVMPQLYQDLPVSLLARCKRRFMVDAYLLIRHGRHRLCLEMRLVLLEQRSDEALI